MAEVIIAPRAISDLEQIWLYIAVESERTADRLSNAIFDKIEQLGDFPQMGPLRNDVGPTVRGVVHSRYLILYEFDAANDRVDVIAVVDGARDLPNLA